MAGGRDVYALLRSPSACISMTLHLAQQCGAQLSAFYAHHADDYDMLRQLVEDGVIVIFCA